MQTDINPNIDPVSATQAGALGSLEAVANEALRRAVQRDEERRRLEWAEENALLIEALGDGAAEAASA